MGISTALCPCASRARTFDLQCARPAGVLCNAAAAFIRFLMNGTPSLKSSLDAMGQHLPFSLIFDACIQRRLERRLSRNRDMVLSVIRATDVRATLSCLAR